ncbi:MAG: hypothetical protein WD895_06585 [Acidimicrobiia bacterium]
MGFRYRIRMLLTTLAVAVVVALPGIAQAETESTEETTTTTTALEVEVPPVTQVTSVLPVLGSGLTVSLTRDETGVITEVALDPSGATIVKEGDHKVVFLLADGDTQVVVKSYSKGKGDDGEATAGGVKTTVTADATADVTGPGSWSADVFGTGVVTIPYVVAFDGNTPSITIGDIVLPDGVTAEIGEPKIKASDEKSKFRIKVTLISGENKARVSFLASTRLDDDGELHVKLAVTLDARNHVRCGWGGDEWRGDRDDRKDRDRGDDDEAVGAAAGFGDRGGSRDDDGWGRDREHRRDHEDGGGDRGEDGEDQG